MAETETKNVVINLINAHDDHDKRMVFKAVSGILGVDSVAVDMAQKKLTVIGRIDPVEVVKKLRKRCRYAEILTVGPAKDGDEKKKENEAAAAAAACDCVTRGYSCVYRGEQNPDPDPNPNPNEHACVIC